MSTVLQDVGRRVRTRRQAQTLTIKDLAERSGVSSRYLVELENGRGNISISRLEDIASALDAPLHGLFVASDVADVVTGLAMLGPAALEEVRQLVSRVRAAPAGPRVVAMMGVRGAGKSSVGRRVALGLGLNFVELDARIEALAGLSLAEIFAIHGPDYYREVEHQALVDLLSTGQGVVVATGGSLVTHPDTWALLRRRALTVWLRADARDHWERVIAQGDLRPMGSNPGAYAQLEALLRARSPLYEEAAVVVDTSARPLDAVVHDVVERVRAGGAQASLHGDP